MHSEISRIDKLLFVIKEFGKEGKLDGRLKLMKIMFFLEHLDIEKDRLVPENLFSDNEFIIYKYGPFSFEVMNDLTKLKNEGVIQELLQGGYYIVPILTDKGIKRVNEIEGKLKQSELERINKIKDIFGNLGGKQLEKKSLEYLKISPSEKESHRGTPISSIISKSG